MQWIVRIAAIFSVFAAATVWSAESGFLSDYSLLEDRPDDVLDRVYLSPELMRRAGSYKGILIDQPEVFMSPDSQYKGVKPDHLKTLADTVRAAITERLAAGGYPIADEPGPGVILFRVAITDLYLQKKKRNVLSFTPAGFVIYATAQAAIRDLWRKIDIVELGVEFEVLDSTTGELLAAIVIGEGARKSKHQKQQLVSWEQLDAVIGTVGERARCHLDNAHAAESERHDCSTILIEPEA